ncbi:MAG: MGMT family protein [Proteobacteria bacterium]|uniref:MGMT family protein n=1 Tax=Candidatus Fonsibacter lacus TaxID=2576439 RepID=A0A964UYI3_9PROT|nr:MGMT family protein [Candidatus Fonsibacter lacus]NBP60196.1 MGMT family protein [Pseudomonadota bacterium]NCU71979.1 MGMT family protein [Candidatus Fonsibacter lacus]
MSTSQLSFKTKLGFISVIEDEGYITDIAFKRITKQKNSPQLLKAKDQIKKFLDKKIKKFKFKTKIFGSKKQIKVWNEIKKIHYAKTVSYNFISKRTKIHPRHVGKICSQNRLLLFIPCHRVIRSNGLLGGFSAKRGFDLKSKIIKIEELNK